MPNLATLKARSAAERRTNQQQIADLRALVENTSQIVASAKRAKATNQAKAPRLTAKQRTEAEAELAALDRSLAVHNYAASFGKFAAVAKWGREVADLEILGTAQARNALPRVKAARNAAAAKLGIAAV